MRSPKYLAVVLVLCLFTLVPPALPAELTNATDVLQFALEKNEAYRSYAADFEQSIRFVGGMMTMPGTIQFKKPALMRMNMIVPIPGHEQQMLVILDPEKMMWQQLSKNNQTNVVKLDFQTIPTNNPALASMPNPIDSVDPKKQLKVATSRYNFELLPSVTENGQPMYVLQGTLKPGVKLSSPEQMLGKLGHQIIHIGQQDGFLHHFEQLDASGTNDLMSMEITNLKLNLPLHDQLFIYSPPAGANVMDMTQQFLQMMKGAASAPVPITGPSEPAPPLK